MIALALTRFRTLRGFTLIELMVVIGIIAVLMALTIPGVTAARKYANSSACTQNLRCMGAAIQSYLIDNDNRLPYALNGVTVYVKPDSDYLGSKIAPYMGYTLIPQKYVFIKEFICPGASRALAESKQENFISYLVKETYAPGVGTVFPFSSGETYGGPRKSGMTMGFMTANTTLKCIVRTYKGVDVEQVGGLSKVIAFQDFDTAYKPSASYTVINAPAHTKRNYLFLDWHVEAF